MTRRVKPNSARGRNKNEYWDRKKMYIPHRELTSRGWRKGLLFTWSCATSCKDSFSLSHVKEPWDTCSPLLISDKSGESPVVLPGASQEVHDRIHRGQPAYFLGFAFPPVTFLLTHAQRYMPFMPVAAFSDIQDRRSGHLWYLRQELVNVNASAFPIGLATTPQQSGSSQRLQFFVLTRLWDTSLTPLVGL